MTKREKSALRDTSQNNAMRARLAREQDLMRRMGERKHEVEVEKSLASYEPKGWIGSCIGWVSGHTGDSKENQNPLWGGDGGRVQADRDDGFYQPMHR